MYTKEEVYKDLFGGSLDEEDEKIHINIKSFPKEYEKDLKAISENILDIDYNRSHMIRLAVGYFIKDIAYNEKKILRNLANNE